MPRMLLAEFDWRLIRAVSGGPILGVWWLRIVPAYGMANPEDLKSSGATPEWVRFPPPVIRVGLPSVPLERARLPACTTSISKLARQDGQVTEMAIEWILFDTKC
jgi:predicted thioredoxin/glutaredoxin